MRTSHARRAAAALGGLLVVAAALAGCSSTVDGVAICPGCSGGVEPEFPTAPTQTPAEPGTNVLEPNAAGYVYIETVSGVTRCQISAARMRRRPVHSCSELPSPCTTARAMHRS